MPKIDLQVDRGATVRGARGGRGHRALDARLVVELPQIGAIDEILGSETIGRQAARSS
jgi:hypothetical protein